jgi:hypothetical protein
MQGVRTEHPLRPLGLIVTAGGIVLSGFGVLALVSLLPIGILVTLGGLVLLVGDAIGDLES